MRSCDSVREERGDRNLNHAGKFLLYRAQLTRRDKHAIVI